ncbi:winged helix DNA-binding domain-containing protein [Archangium lipolyticum]|uniref:winged helix DNA-binding domain-containing protein n=1 Tax=Archangium lipolyticum TaxID=2970465 RepID=UPI002149F9A8|nr:winged helix DNA-binding domain-containing protein [Archangium lipolyticum]
MSSRRSKRASLGRLMEERRVVRSALMRGTLHLVTARDFLKLRPVPQPVLERLHNGSYGRRFEGLDAHEVVAVGCALLEEQPRTSAELGKLLLSPPATRRVTTCGFDPLE